MFKIGASTIYNPINEELFKSYKNGGIELMEVSLTKDQCDSLDFKKLSELSKTYDVELWSFHLPFSPNKIIDISNPKLSESTVSYFYELIKKASSVGIDKFVVHPSSEPIDDLERPEKMECAKHSLAKLSQLAKKEGAVICVEDLPRTCLGNSSKEILELISLDDSLRVCFDTNHLLCENIVDFIRNVSDKIITTHISDYDFIDERHWLPGKGMINWSELIEALNDVGYTGAWVYEILFGNPVTTEKCALTCEDFSKNAKELF